MPNSATYLAEERRVAIDVVQTACRITTRVFQSLVSSDTLTKKDKSPVTIGDYSAQALVNLILAKHFPDDALVGEENAEDLRIDAGAGMRDQIVQLVNGVLPQGAERVPTEALLDAIDRGNYPGGKGRRFWALDPIDGTKGFLRGGQYAVCLALLVNGRVELGVMGCPNLPLDAAQPKPADGEIRTRDIPGLGALFIAVRGQGAFVVRCAAHAATDPGTECGRDAGAHARPARRLCQGRVLRVGRGRALVADDERAHRRAAGHPEGALRAHGQPGEVCKYRARRR